MKRQNRINQRTRRLTLTAMLSALSVALMYVGALLEVMEITTVAITALFVLFALREMGLGHAFALYAAASILSLLLIPRPSVGVLYVLFGGLYPLLKFPLERHRRPLPLLFKLLYLNVIITAVELLAGLLCNRLLQMRVWDYSNRRGNFKGQICPLYSFLWCLLCLPVLPLCGWMKRKFDK